MPLSSFPSVESGYSLIKIPTFDTRIINYGNKIEQRLSMSDAAQYHLKLTFDKLDLDDANLIEAFFITCKGKYTAFYLSSEEEAYRDVIWKASTAYILNQIVRPVTATGRSYKCTTAGTSGSSEPSWTSTVNGTNSDGSVTWTENTYTVRFIEDTLNIDYFQYNLYNLGQIEFIEVSA